MGCGGSRADAIEPRYYESWTRETESTWLTNTDSESPPPGDGAAEPAPRPGPGPGPGPGPDILEDGKSTQTGVTTTSTTPGILNTEKKPSSGPQCANPTVPTSGAAAQRPNSFRTAESKRDTRKTPPKEVTINVTKSIRQSDRRIVKSCVK
ncbi:brain and acute leukemia cytoplasmic protein [Rhea pennata]|uniref:brain and acute leukemia cytoplasmic protein n=1 Tax=Rhea pennata TaxID=8795 RepID=UPI002E257769